MAEVIVYKPLVAEVIVYKPLVAEVIVYMPLVADVEMNLQVNVTFSGNCRKGRHRITI